MGLTLQAPKLGPCVLADFDIGKVLGTGSFGRVSLAFHRATGVWCALKTLVKAHVVRNQQLPHLLSERDVLRSVDHPFVVRMLGCFQDADCVHLVMEFVAGGEFFSHLRARGKLTEDVAKFYAAQVVLVFEYLHSNSIVYRDLKVSVRIAARPSPCNAALDRQTEGILCVMCSLKTCYWTLRGTSSSLTLDLPRSCRGPSAPTHCAARQTT